jgi:hypothetical protein
MAWESVVALRTTGGDPGRRTRIRAWMRGLPMKRRFPRSGLYISIIPPIGIGFFVGMLAAILGVGGGFILAPAMVYLLGVPTRVMVGTSLFQIIFLTAYVTFLQATFNGTVDLVLAFVLMVGGVIGARYGAIAGRRLKAAQVRLLLALLVLGSFNDSRLTTAWSGFSLRWYRALLADELRRVAQGIALAHDLTAEVHIELGINSLKIRVVQGFGQTQNPSWLPVENNLSGGIHRP